MSSPEDYQWGTPDEPWGGDQVRGEYPPERQAFLDANPDSLWTPPGDVVYQTYPAYLRFPPVPASVVDASEALLEVNAMAHQPDQLGSLALRWGVDTADLPKFSWMCVTRSGYGFPATPNDGTPVVMRRRNEVDPVYDTDTNLKLWGTIDANLQPGRWYYYSFFVKTNPYDWQLVKRTHCLVPVNYHHDQILWDMIPPYYRWVDDDSYSGVGLSPLRRLLSMMGYNLDFIRTEAEGIEDIYSADRAPMQLYRALGEQNFGIKPSSALGDVRFRRVTARANELARLRGTVPGLEAFIETASQYVTLVTPGRNELLVSDDSEFLNATGHWATPAANVAELLGQLHGPAIDFVRTLDTDISLTSEINPPVVETRTPKLKLGRGVMRLAPVWDGAAWKTNSRGEITSRLATTCGIGTKLVQKDVDSYKKIEQNPTLYGVPIVGGKRYYLSFYFARSGMRPDQFTGDPVAVTDDESNVRFGFAWYSRGSVKGNEAFSDAFSRRFLGYRTIDPLALTVTTYTPTIATANTWEYVIGTFQAPSGAEFACPVIEFDAADISARFIAAVMVSPENEAGRIVSYGPDIFFRLGHDPQEPGDHLLGGDKVLGDPSGA